MAKKLVILVDLEGTLSDSRHRGVYTKDEHENWHNGFMADRVNYEIKAILQSLKFPYIIVSAKPMCYLGDVETWIQSNMDKEPIEVHMRKIGDYNTSPALKEVILKDLLDHYTPILAIDDRADVCSMYNRNRIPAIQFKLPLIGV